MLGIFLREICGEALNILNLTVKSPVMNGVFVRRLNYCPLFCRGQHISCLCGSDQRSFPTVLIYFQDAKFLCMS